MAGIPSSTVYELFRRVIPMIVIQRRGYVLEHVPRISCAQIKRRPTSPHHNLNRCPVVAVVAVAERLL
jgi:hypothetical protein